MNEGELMIGDIVLWKGDNSPHRVRAIELNGIESDAENFSIPSWDFSAIPLTTNDLLRNGWKQSPNDCRIWYHPSVNSRFRVLTLCGQFKAGTLYTTLHSGDDFSPYREEETCYVLTNITYVHQLQQILRLCGHSKLANSFAL